MKKLHLGCGTRYLNEYINIDFPPTQHTVQEHLVADRYEDICTLCFQNGSIDEVRLHHVFEHFPRQTALALLCRWTDWLKQGATLRIETPDLALCARTLAFPWVSDNKKSQVVRHLFGSHEAAWAVHWDGWYKERFKRTLSLLGYENIRFERNRYEKVLHNIEVFATRNAKKFSLAEYEALVSKLLGDSLITHATKHSACEIAESEKIMHSVWMSEWKTAYLFDATDREISG